MICVRTLVPRKMEDEKYQELLKHLQNLTSQNEEYKKWASQFYEKLNHVYKGERRVIP